MQFDAYGSSTIIIGLIMIVFRKPLVKSHIWVQNNIYGYRIKDHQAKGEIASLIIGAIAIIMGIVYMLGILPPDGFAH